MTQGEDDRSHRDRLEEYGSGGVPPAVVDTIQPSGFLIAVSADWTVTHVSGNAPSWLGCDVEGVFARPLLELLASDAAHALRGRLQLLSDPGLVERFFGLTLQDGAATFDVAMHRSGRFVVIEAEPSVAEAFDATDLVRNMSYRLQQTGDARALCRQAARQMRILTGFDGVAVCRFGGDGMAEVIDESARPTMTIGDGRPLSAAELVEPAGWQWGALHAVADVVAEPVAVVPRPGTPPLDLSMSSLRAPTPARRERLRRHGAAAAIGVPVLRGRQLWGALVCQSLRPRRMSLRHRTAAELFAQLFALSLESRERADGDRHVARPLGDVPTEAVPEAPSTDEHRRASAQDRQELLIAELNHRIRNILGLIQGVVVQSRTSAGSVDDYAAVVAERIQALGRAHDQIARAQGAPSSLRALIASETGAYLGGGAERVRLDGNDVLLEPRAFSTLALVIHELATNAAKYGALCNGVGQVDVTWRVAERGRLVIHWRESGGPPVRPPTRRGFGTTILERSIPYELGGEASVEHAPGGVGARLTIPGEFVRPALPAMPPAGPGQGALRSQPEARVGGSVLVVEDNMLIALDAEEMFQHLGADRIETAGSVRDALRLIAANPPGFALLDVSLGPESSLPVALRLRELGVPFAFATGYGETLALPSELGAVPIVEKPFSLDVLRRTYAQVVDRARRP